MKFAYSDPPYLGCSKFYDHPESYKWDDPSHHGEHFEFLCDQYPDGWAYSLSSVSLRTLLPLAPSDVRVASWVKTFAAYKRNVRNAYTWEPVLVWKGRLSSRDGAPVTRDHLQAEVDDHLAEPITLRKGFTGAKPDRFNEWILKMLGFVPNEDMLDDLFPGTGGMAVTLARVNGDGWLPPRTKKAA